MSETPGRTTPCSGSPPFRPVRRRAVWRINRVSAGDVAERLWCAAKSSRLLRERTGALSAAGAPPCGRKQRRGAPIAYDYSRFIVPPAYRRRHGGSVAMPLPARKPRSHSWRSSCWARYSSRAPFLASREWTTWSAQSWPRRLVCARCRAPGRHRRARATRERPGRGRPASLERRPGKRP